MKTLRLRKSIGRSPLRLGFLLIPFVLGSFALSPTARAVTPAPDGGYSGFNTAEGEDALFSLTTGLANTANGAFALYENTTGSFNTASGFWALVNNTTGSDNTATGFIALSRNAQGRRNTANGVGALANNTNGRDNTAHGLKALFSNGTGQGNTANGAFALYENTTGNFNTANGNVALYHNTGSDNIALGGGAGQNLTTGNNNIDIGNVGVAGEANTIRIGTKETQTATFIAGISGKTAGGGIPVVVNANGKLGTTVSSVRFKEQIKPMDKASEAIHALKPVTFRYKQELDPEGIPQFGLVAEEVEKVNPDLVARDDQGKVYTVRYDAVNAMLLNEFLKQHRKVEEQQATIAQVKSTRAEQEATIIQLKSTVAKQEATIAQLKDGMKGLTATLKEQAAQIQKVSDQLELTKPAPQMVGNN
jgi:uncharacterized coiled-coil protein SlyX